MRPDDLVHILAAGGGVILSAKGIAVNDLVRIAATAKQHKRTVVIKDALLSTSDLVQIAAAGEGAVLFDF